MTKDTEGWILIGELKSIDELLDDLLNGGEDLDIPIDDMTELEAPVSIDIDDMEEDARKSATLLTLKLSGYYFDLEYIELHPYIPIKIETEMNNIRRLMKSLSINEKALEILITNICKTPNKGNLFIALNSMQKGMDDIQSSLSKLIKELESIFKEMQAECEKTWKDKDKEMSDDGTMTVRGSRDFIKELQQKLWATKELQTTDTNETKEEQVG